MQDVQDLNQSAATVIHSPINRRRFLEIGVSATLLVAIGSRANAQDAVVPSIATGWNASDIPSQAGRTVVITGGNGVPQIVPEGTFPPAGVYSGLGFQDARALAAKGANVIIASRNKMKGREAVASIKAEYPEALIRFESLDLSDLSSVSAFAGRLRSQVDRVDILINNAATAGTPDRRVNAAGDELCWATNVVGHYSLTAHLFPLLRVTEDPRVVFLGSGAARRTETLDDLQTETAYSPLKAYAVSKAALLIMTRDLARRSLEEGWGVKVLASHPGTAKTFLIPSGPGPDSDFGRSISNDPDRFRPAEIAALSTLYAATHQEAESGSYYGPINDDYDVGLSEDHISFEATDAASRLYEVLEHSTGQRLA